MRKNTIYIASDHAGFALKTRVIEYLKKLGFEIKDFGPYKLNPGDDYPDFVVPMAQAVARATSTISPPHIRGRIKVRVLGIAICGTGIGVCIAANKVRRIRAATVYDLFTARCSREHNNANIICLGSRAKFTRNFTNVKKILNTCLTTPFSNKPRHVRRLKKIEKYEHG